MITLKLFGTLKNATFNVILNSIAVGIITVILYYIQTLYL